MTKKQRCNISKRYRIKHRAKRISEQRERRKKAKQLAISYKGGKCIDCGFSDNSRPECFDFDHLPEFKKNFCLAGRLGDPWTSIVEELDKCDLVCSNCHRTRTFRRGSGIGGNGKIEI